MKGGLNKRVSLRVRLSSEAAHMNHLDAFPMGDPFTIGGPRRDLLLDG